jgi:LysR family transcriptional regulator, hypochlorite-specific transcription factor HypT
MGPGNRPLDLEWLEDFLALAETGNFSRAAEVRAIAQPAFSRHIRALEDWVGVELFDRSAHPAALTAAGQRFLPLLQATLAQLESARTRAREAHEIAASTLRFAATHVLSLTFFPRWLAGLESRLDMGPIQTMSDSSQACEDLMLQRRVQFVLCHGHPAVPGRLDEAQYPMQRISDDVLQPVSAPDPADPQRPLHAMGQPAAVPVLAYSEASGLGRIMRSRMRSVFSDTPDAAGQGRGGGGVHGAPCGAAQDHGAGGARGGLVAAEPYRGWAAVGGSGGGGWAGVECAGGDSVVSAEGGDGGCGGGVVGVVG